jgi:hypothetical protein
VARGWAAVGNATTVMVTSSSGQSHVCGRIGKRRATRHPPAPGPRATRPTLQHRSLEGVRASPEGCRVRGRVCDVESTTGYEASSSCLCRSDACAGCGGTRRRVWTRELQCQPQLMHQRQPPRRAGKPGPALQHALQKAESFCRPLPGNWLERFRRTHDPLGRELHLRPAFDSGRRQICFEFRVTSRGPGGSSPGVRRERVILFRGGASRLPRSS